VRYVDWKLEIGKLGDKVLEIEHYVQKLSDKKKIFCLKHQCSIWKVSDINNVMGYKKISHAVTFPVNQTT